MKVLHVYEVKTVDGVRYQGEIAYKDQEKLVLRLRHRTPEQKLRFFKNGIISVKELGWHKAFALR
ncbi:hypothetical protein IBX73_11515 [candidate division WOR-3 bacterium]|nr:hypothetical protein [candidate division WOR-3 bacterium]